MLTTHADTDESPHLCDADELWQESSAVAWLDAETGAGGYFRIGHEPNRRGGEWALGFGVVTRDGLRYRRNEAGPLTDADRLAHGLGARDGHFAIDWDGALQGRAEDDGCRLELTVEDFYPRTDFFGLAAGAVRQVAASHFESSGTVSRHPPSRRSVLRHRRAVPSRPQLGRAALGHDPEPPVGGGDDARPGQVKS